MYVDKLALNINIVSVCVDDINLIKVVFSVDVDDINLLDVTYLRQDWKSKEILDQFKLLVWIANRCFFLPRPFIATQASSTLKVTVGIPGQAGEMHYRVWLY